MANKKTAFGVPDLSPVERQVLVRLNKTICARCTVLYTIVALCCSDAILARAKRTDLRIRLKFKDNPQKMVEMLFEIFQEL